LGPSSSSSLGVGELGEVEKNQRVPADLILLRKSDHRLEPTSSAQTNLMVRQTGNFVLPIPNARNLMTATLFIWMQKLW
jgi:hypothetical protein